MDKLEEECQDVIDEKKTRTKKSNNQIKPTRKTKIKDSHHLCIYCGRLFTTKWNLIRHTAICVHNPDSSESRKDVKFMCEMCSQTFSTKFGVKRHINNCHKAVKPKNDKIKIVRCAMCDYETDKSTMLQHYSDIHYIDMSVENFKFESFMDFEEWKDAVEHKDISKYVRYGLRKLREKTIYYYRCHRDGEYKGSGQNQRKIKHMGSNKINGYCPSRMDVTISRNGKVFVNFRRSHAGHEMELGRIPLSKSDRDRLAEKIRQNIPFDEILHCVRDSAKENKSDRLHLLTKKDLFNIKELYKLKKEGTKLNLKTESANENGRTNDISREREDEEEDEQAQEEEAWTDNHATDNYCESVVEFYECQGEEIKLKEELMLKFQAILDSAKNLDQCRVIEEALIPLPAILSAMTTTLQQSKIKTESNTSVKNNYDNPTKTSSLKKRQHASGVKKSRQLRVKKCKAAS